ncbi:hypothetical protein GGR28_003151 [Lewinella aquimaris]|uniref:Peptidase metallopeptidase domain-containing protein n=1 Tax=Neolewinella aquimaris TaxID=1835722 RepID=A0A840EAQ3_9BACT|nr:matrixin family metalloprotease [Neolewinella aquimaris]MBB4080517.1 hypothetical protein [Neolewinella aquimaris]
MHDPLQLSSTQPFATKSTEELQEVTAYLFHQISDNILCDTDSIGHAQPDGRSSTELVLDAPNGFIPLWEPNSTLMWRFQERSFVIYRNPEAAKQYVRNLLTEAIIAWGDAVPVRFSERSHGVDFEIAINPAAKCYPAGCVLASAFFPDSGQHELVLYPTLFEQSRQEQLETMIHELGHVFGLRHFFAKTHEPQRNSVLFGEQNSFTIMNYGPNSQLTDADRNDLRRLYQEVWSGQRQAINGTPVQQVTPYSTLLYCNHGGVTYQSV